MTTLRIQSILFHNEPESLVRAVKSLHRAADLAIAAGVFSSVELAWGDCSAVPVFSPEAVAALSAENDGYLAIKYTVFGSNLGSARGHNTLLEAASADFILIMNPDVVVAPNLLAELRRPFSRPDVGMVEARQLPIEHPKAYDPVTGETCWAATACALIPAEVFRRVGPFDADTFFLYCDDVDFSWRVRLAGLKVVYQPAAVVFHDKRLSEQGGWMPGGAEKYYSAEAALMLSYKWSRTDLCRQRLRQFRSSGIEHLEKAAREFERRERAGQLPPQLDADHRVGEFVGDMYATHRFAL